MRLVRLGRGHEIEMAAVPDRDSRWSEASDAISSPGPSSVRCTRKNDLGFG